MKQNFRFIVFILLLSACSVLKKRQKMIVPKKVKATISIKAGKDCKLIYYFGNESYEHSIEKSNFIDGERYSVVCDSLNPANYQPLFFEKHHYANEELYRTYGVIKRIELVPDVWGFTMFYDCRIGLRDYKFTQKLPLHYKQLYPKIRKGQKFEVECLMSNLQNAIMYLDRPILN